MPTLFKSTRDIRIQGYTSEWEENSGECWVGETTKLYVSEWNPKYLNLTTKPCLICPHSFYQSNLFSFPSSFLLFLQNTRAHSRLRAFAIASAWNALYLNSYLKDSFPHFIKVSSTVNRKDDPDNSILNNTLPLLHEPLLFLTPSQFSFIHHHLMNIPLFNMSTTRMCSMWAKTVLFIKNSCIWYMLSI